MRTFSLLLQSLILKLAVIAHAANSSEFKLEDELINFFGYTFEYWDSANWTDASRGGVTWKVEDGNSEELNDAKVRPPPPPSGNKYLRLYPSPDGTFSPAVFSGFYYETGGQQFKRLRFSFEYWLSSEYFEHNNIQVYLQSENWYQRLINTEFYRHSTPDSSWHIYAEDIDVANVNIPERFTITIFGFCGLSDLDGIALDNIFLSGWSSSSTNEPVTNSTTTVTDMEITSTGTNSTGSEVETTTSPVNFETTPAITGTTASESPICITAEIKCNAPSDYGSYSITEDSCSNHYCVCGANGVYEEVCKQSGHVFDSEKRTCQPCGQVEACRGGQCNSHFHELPNSSDKFKLFNKRKWHP